MQGVLPLVTDHVTDLIRAKSMVVDLEYYENSRCYDALVVLVGHRFSAVSRAYRA